jgi:hypothetical protein
MRTDKDYPFPLPINDNKKKFLKALQDVLAAVKQRKGVIKDYDEQALPGGGISGVIVVEEDVL